VTIPQSADRENEWEIPWHGIKAVGLCLFNKVILLSIVHKMLTCLQISGGWESIFWIKAKIFSSKVFWKNKFTSFVCYLSRQPGKSPRLGQVKMLSSAVWKYSLSFPRPYIVEGHCLLVVSPNFMSAFHISSHSMKNYFKLTPSNPHCQRSYYLKLTILKSVLSCGSLALMALPPHSVRERFCYAISGSRGMSSILISNFSPNPS
jgi:hypothetical protein